MTGPASTGKPGSLGSPESRKLELRARGIYLKPIQLRDAEALYRKINDKEIARWSIAIPYPYARSELDLFLRRAIREMRTGQRYIFAIRRYDSTEPIGVIDLTNIDLNLRTAEIGYWLGRMFWNQGIMTQAVKLLLAFAFNTLKLHRILVRHLEGNDASRRVIEKCWFRREGVERELVFKNRRWHNLIRYGLLAREYQALVLGRSHPIGH